MRDDERGSGQGKEKKKGVVSHLRYRLPKEGGAEEDPTTEECGYFCRLRQVTPVPRKRDE